jgi:hypothetical protein
MTWMQRGEGWVPNNHPLAQEPAPNAPGRKMQQKPTANSLVPPSMLGLQQAGQRLY